MAYGNTFLWTDKLGDIYYEELGDFKKALDEGYHGYDCSLRSCPEGDDPGTWAQKTEQQIIQCIYKKVMLQFLIL